MLRPSVCNIPLAQQRCSLGLWLLEHHAGAALETFARCLHYRYAPIELPSAGGGVSFGRGALRCLYAGVVVSEVGSADAIGSRPMT